MKNSKTERKFYSATPDMYATIPAWALWSKTLKTAKCYHYNRRKSIMVDLDQLRQLVSEHKVWLSQSPDNDQYYVTSKAWRKYF